MSGGKYSPRGSATMSRPTDLVTPRRRTAATRDDNFVGDSG